MQISFIILFMIDLYKDNHVHTFVNFFFEKLLRKLLTGFLPNFTGIFLRKRLKTSFAVIEKSGLWSDTGAEAPSVSSPVWKKTFMHYHVLVFVHLY